VSQKQTIRSGIRQIKRVHTWQLVVVLILCGFLAATFLRLNNIGMIERREAVLTADESGDSEQIRSRLYDLQRYVSSHMNTDPGRIALTGQYERDSERIKQVAEQANTSNPNGNVYARAAEVCDPIAQANGWRWPDTRYTQCIDNELQKFPEAAEVAYRAELPDTNMYYHTYQSPRWSPDFAGFSVLACVVVALVIVLRFISLAVLTLLLRMRYKSL